MKIILNNIIGLSLIAVAIAGVGRYAVDTVAALKSRELENIARFQCAQSSSYETKDASGALVRYPMEELYQACLREKGIK